MKRHRVDISPQAKEMLKRISKRLEIPGISHSMIAELCIQNVYQKSFSEDLFTEQSDPVMQKLDEIHSMLQEVLPEI